MTDREKLIGFLKEIAHENCFGSTEKIADHLLAHGVYVRETQKPCKFEEISLREYCWVEYKYEFYTSVEIACALCKTSECCRIDFVGVGSSIAHKKELYNKTWRVWNKKPTEEERKNAKWEE